MRLRTALFSAALALSSAALAAEGPAPRTAVASLPPVAGVVEAVGGEAWRCVPLVREGSDPHAYEPTPRQMAALAEAEVFFESGMPFERALAERVRRLNPSLRVVELACGHDHAHGHGHAHGHDAGEDGEEGGDDPHGWLSTTDLLRYAEEACEAFSALDPARAGDYEAARSRYAERAQRVAAEARARLQAAGVRAFAAFHPAYGHFAAEFGLRQIALEEDGRTPGPRHLAAVERAVREEGARVLLVQSGSEERRAAAFLERTGLTVRAANPLGRDALAVIAAVADALASGAGAAPAEAAP